MTEKLMPLKWNAEEIDQVSCHSPGLKKRSWQMVLNGMVNLAVKGEVPGALVMWFFWENLW